MSPFFRFKRTVKLCCLVFRKFEGTMHGRGKKMKEIKLEIKSSCIKVT